ncbi:hypothetical protein [Amycolatopsis albispora]|uniref:Heavy metal-binding domain-containing protein n=1 Tax=Amycolatopsis albispora TaxID=1804986 RepID=A0A344L0M0_9PSEU|nr:hypothetical protein [Amycolatopsis albispora]AXB41594.1 hypothetical protein A4R43_02865 [Amycolatopsis albispora]
MTTHALVLQQRELAPGAVELRFHIAGPDGAPVTEFDSVHDKRIHLIVVRHDLTGFWHVHPAELGGGTWSAHLTLPDPGRYRVFADIAPTGAEPTTISADLLVTGKSRPRPLPEPGRVSAVGAYEVELDGELEPGTHSPLTLTVRRDGQPVTDLQPYLGAYGHLVALRTGSLDYLHVHPDGQPGDGVTAAGPDIGFHAAVGAAGTYRLFLDFRHHDTVHTAQFTATTR